MHVFEIQALSPNKKKVPGLSLDPFCMFCMGFIRVLRFHPQSSRMARVGHRINIIEFNMIEMVNERWLMCELSMQN